VSFNRSLFGNFQVIKIRGLLII